MTTGSYSCVSLPDALGRKSVRKPYQTIVVQRTRGTRISLHAREPRLTGARRRIIKPENRPWLPATKARPALLRGTIEAGKVAKVTWAGVLWLPDRGACEPVRLAPPREEPPWAMPPAAVQAKAHRCGRLSILMTEGQRVSLRPAQRCTSRCGRSGDGCVTRASQRILKPGRRQASGRKTD